MRSYKREKIERLRRSDLVKRLGSVIAVGTLAILITGFEGCGSVVESSLAEAVAEPQAAAQSSSQFSAAQAPADKQSLLEYHLLHAAKQPGPKIQGGNDVRLLIDGPAAYDAIFSAIQSAKKTIDIEMYIFDDGDIGSALSNLLREKSRAGVQVRLIYDSVGCLRTPGSFFDEMRDAGVAMIEFHPVNPLAGKFLRLNNRDHRKIVIVDNRVAYTGGINISSVYAHGSGIYRKKKNRDEEAAIEDGWRDTQIEITGPAVNTFSDLFDSMWMLGKGEPSLALPARVKSELGKKYVRVIGSSPEDDINLIYSDLIAAIKRSRHSIHITMSYFSPNRAMIEALEAAARRGVDVQLVLPGFSDWWPVLEAGRYHYNDLIEAGVKIYERKDVFLHAKTAVIDGVWSTVGSSNMDLRSFLHNYEVNVVILGEGFGQSMEDMFSKDRANATFVEQQQWQERPFLLRVKQRISRIFTYWL